MKKSLLILFAFFLCAGSSWGQITAFPYNQDFSTGALPAGWNTEVTIGTGTIPWVFGTNAHSGLMLSPTAANGYASFNAPAMGVDVLEATLTSPVFDFTGKTVITLEFYHLLIWNQTDGYVEYSIDGGATWALGVAFESQINPSEKVTLDFSAELANEANVKLRWRGVKTTSDNYWENWSIDDIKVSASSFIVDFSASPTIGTAPLEVAFTHADLPAGTYTYAWDFGDGDDSTDENPSHTYTTDGVYTVTLSVTNTGTSEVTTTQKDDLIMVIPFSGEGTQADPFLIATLDDLHVMSGVAALWDKYFELSADIDAAGTETDPLYNNGGAGFSPIGSVAKPFNGNFDGKGFVISNLYINANFNNKGLFGSTKNTQIKNLGVTNAEILGTGSNQGILIGDDAGTSGTIHSVIENCYTTGSVSGGSYRIGGFIGDVERTEIKDSFTISSVNGQQQGGGTFAGYSYYAVFDNCYAQGSVYMSKDGAADVGGFIGASYGDKITNCYATAAVTSFEGATSVGGFAGFFASTYGGIFNGCYWDTETTGQATSDGPVSDYYKGLTTAEFSDENNFMENDSTSWDFTNTWIMGIIPEDVVVRPRLTWKELPAQSQTITLNQGWNAWSSYANPTSKLSMEDVLNPIVDDMIVTQHFTELYYPEYGINTFGNMNNSHGYMTKMANAAVLIISGNMADPTINLTEGWNLMPVLSECAVAAADLFSTMSELVIAVDPAGNGIYYPGGGIYTLTSLLPGKAYWVKVGADVEYTYPECLNSKTNSSSTSLRSNNNTNWNDVNYTGINHVIVIDENATKLLQNGDKIGAFTSNGQCAGLVEYTGGQIGLNLCGDDVSTRLADGFIENEAISFRLYRPASGEEFNLEVSYDTEAPNADGLFVVNGVSVITDFKFSAN